MPVFHNEQRIASREIIAMFQKQPMTILLAQMQSGKTGTYLFTALEMIRQGLVEDVVIICGSSDTSLRSQTISDLKAAKDAYLDEIDPEGNLPRRLTDIYENLNVFFSQDLGKAPEINEKTLIIHDESHMAQSKNNSPFKAFYRKNNLDSALMGDFKVLKEKGNYILGVSATPFSEIVVNKKVQKKDWTTEEKTFLKGVNLDLKNFYFMKPGSDYIGVTELILAGAIKFEAEEIKIEECKHIASVLRKNYAKYEQKYVVIRTHRAEKDKTMMRTIAAQLGYDYKSVFGGENTDLEFLETQPFKATVVHICGRFRMGQVVYKRNIAMAYEQSQKPNADTILQGLLGRMCGYQSQGAHTDLDIYVAPSAEELIRKYHRAWASGEIDTLSEVTRAMNLGGTKRKNGGVIISGENKEGEMIDWIKTVPIRFRLSDLKDDGDETIKFTRKHLTLDAITRLIQQRKRDDPTFPDIDKIEETILNCAGPGKLNLHNSKGDESKSYNSGLHYSTLYEASESHGGQKIRCNVSPSCPKGSAIWRNPFSILGEIGPNKECFLMGFIPYDPLAHPPEVIETAKVNPKCNYIPGEVTLESGLVLENFNGGQIITFSLETSEDPDLFEKELQRSICRTLPDHPSYIEGAGRAITSLYDKKSSDDKGIRLEKSHYSEAKINDIFDRIEQKYNVKLVKKKSRGRQPIDYIKFASISW